MKHRITDAEERISALEDDFGKENILIKELSKKVSSLCQQVDDLESRSRRNNIRIMGLKEGSEGDDLMGFLGRLFQHILGENIPTPEVDRAHRASRPRPDPEDPPRNIIVRFMRWSDKQNILVAVKKERSLSWQGRPFTIRQDLPAEVRRQRAEYNDIIEDLKKKKMRVGVLYPARLIVTIDGEKMVYNNPEEARKELQKRL